MTFECFSILIFIFSPLLEEGSQSNDDERGNHMATLDAVRNNKTGDNNPHTHTHAHTQALATLKWFFEFQLRAAPKFHSII